MRRSTPCAKAFPLCLDCSGNFKGSRSPAIGRLGVRQLGCIGQRTMALGGILGRMPQGDMGFAINHRRARTGFSGANGAVNINRIMAIARKHIPAAGGKARLLVGDVRHRHFAIYGDAIVIPHHDQPRQLLLACQCQCLLRNTFHQTAVARHHIGMVINDLGPPTCAQVFFGNRKTYRIGDALT